jgi:RND family efflux transporter MFP subunit
MKPATFKHFIEVQAKVDGDEDVLLSAESAGSITSISVDAGDKVSKGQVLATIDDRIIRQSISEVQTQLDLATTVFNRQKNLWDQKIGSEIQYLQAKSGKESMERRMATLNEQLDMTRIKAPINGVVDAVNIKIGQTVAPGVPAIRVINLNSLKVKAEVPESYITRVSKGDEAIVSFPDDKKDLNVKVDYSGNRIDPLNRTFNVEVKLNDKTGSFRPNMIAILKIVDYTNKSAFIVPVAAVQNSGEGQFVYVKAEEGGKLIAKRKKVEVGTIYNGTAEIKSGLSEGDEVITAGYANVVEGDLIKL